ncbi:MAG: DUF2461 domain-containing protein [Anaerolineales bacterium]|nr:DUF2461 domain-containing protein [Anaerolineales bacterium]
MTSNPFNGFPKESLQFFTDLKANNNKPWFDANKPDYENYVLAPARDFVVALGESLRDLSPDVVADPRVNKSIFRIYRDIRFSRDKTLYKTHLALWFLAGVSGGKFENPGYYFHLEPGNLMLGVGIHTFSKPLLQAYREAVVSPEFGPELAQITAVVLKKGYGVGSKTYKRVPRGYDPDHQYADLLCYSGLTSGVDLEIPAELHTPELIDFCMDKYRDMAPVVHWLQRMKDVSGI